jgi:hypothetical protein
VGGRLVLLGTVYICGSSGLQWGGCRAGPQPSDRRESASSKADLLLIDCSL